MRKDHPDTVPPVNAGVAIVTGASSGIGASFARRLAALSAGKERYRGIPAFSELWLLARRADRLEALAAELSAAAPGLRLRVLSADMAAGGSALLEKELATRGEPLSILVNNAGFGSYGPFSAAPLEAQLGQIDLNCRALTEACWRLGPFLTRGSLVVNVASLAGFFPLADFAVYAASKAYVLNFSVALAAEWRERGVRVHALCPGSVQSEFALVASAGARREVLHGWSADKLTAACLRSAGRGAWISVPRIKWKLNRRVGVLAGPVVVARFAARFMKRPRSPLSPGA